MFCTGSLDKIVDDSVQIFGGYGVMDEYLIQKLYRDARITKIIEGTNEIQHVVIAKEMLR